MLPRFRCLTPRDKKEALRLLRGEGDTRILAGGTDLLVDIRKYTCCPQTLVDVVRVRELSWGFKKEGLLSPLLTHAFISGSSDIMNDFPTLASGCSQVGSPQIRNMATIGGNIANACPAADSVPPLLIHDALLTIESLDSERQEAVEGFLRAPYRTSLARDEMITSVRVTRLNGYRFGLKRLSIRAALSISRLSVAWGIKERGGVYEDVRIAVGSCTPVAFRARESEAFLKGRKASKDSARMAVEMILKHVRSVTGERPTHAFKLPILRNILEEVLKPCS
jgi:CO/xanthine dehydrogenase FAD-binding subunit